MQPRILAVFSALFMTAAGCAGRSTGSGTTASGYSTYGGPAKRSVSRSARYHAPASPPASGSTSDREPPPPPAPGGAGATVPPRSRPSGTARPAPLSQHNARRLTIRRPTERPGLATRFGERLSSRVRYTAFHRSTTRPLGMATIHYNDRNGLVAMARYLRRRCCSTLPARRVSPGITVQLVDRFQRPLPGLQVSGRTIVMGRHHQRYGILVRNHTARRWEIVASVDGLDVIDGRRARASKRGYILAPWGHLFIQGYRTSAQTVAAFRFGSVANSYVKRTTGSSRNVGVVGVAAFAEYVPRTSTYEVERRLRASPFSPYAQPPR